jgi:hypothetical protein
VRAIRDQEMIAAERRKSTEEVSELAALAIA